MNTPPENRPTDTKVAGFTIGWGAMIFASMVAFYVPAGWIFVVIIPIALIISFQRNGTSQMAKGVALALGSALALCLLALAACFGMLRGL